MSKVHLTVDQTCNFVYLPYMKVWIAQNDVQLRQIELEETPFASGGEGSLFKVLHPDYAHLVAKIYHPKRRTQLRRDKIRYLQEHAPEPFEPDAPITLVLPQDTLTDETGQFLGFLIHYSIKPKEMEGRRPFKSNA